jgi:chromosome segregation ATPase
MKRRNADLERRLATAQAELASAKAQIEDADSATASRIKQLIDASEQSDAELVQLRDRLLATEQRIGNLVRARVDAEARLAELRPRLEAARQEAARLRGQLAKAQTDLDEAGAARAVAEEERNAARVQSEFLAGRLRRELAAANEKMKQVMAKNGELERRAVWPMSPVREFPEPPAIPGPIGPNPRVRSHPRRQGRWPDSRPALRRMRDPRRRNCSEI